MYKRQIDNSKIKILVCCHKQCELPLNTDNIFLPIHVGAAINSIDLKMQRDDQVNGVLCDNISSKNKSFCELTAMYWAWKNIKKLYPSLEYIGLNHYRRYFAFEKYYGLRDIYPETDVLNYIINMKRLTHFLAEGYTIIPKRKIYPYPLQIDYSVCHVSEDIRTLRKVIIDLYPEYITSYDHVLLHNNKLAHYNMLIMEYSHFDSYSDWLFSILFEAEKRIDIHCYNDIQMRIFGYMSERLFCVWLYHNKIKTKEVPVYWFTNIGKQGLLQYMFDKHRNKTAFRIKWDYMNSPFRKLINIFKVK
ncbi:DUF4422 domain-containing protein [Treponema brennaborense]|uniref:Exopolysaccharide biosynthesis protein n=1 Tax=Treponema brennaborense (strain DSM 12168 / CIP 105900 / DD5/3) TaxID=906968 RepID=F4LMH3_TREBD|nr:DUF4422 domain-containing protein [Treponema brennaborense]AEE15735.1 exopolysaccharide biosynthesis protein [Treponema brennaborense DSM 12168]